MRKKARKDQIGAKQFNLGFDYYDACLADLWATDAEKEVICEWMKNPKFFFLLLGSTGTGKTYLSAALLNYFFDQGDEIYYINSRHFFQAIQEAIKMDQNQYGAIKKFIDQDILILDDIGAGRTTEWQQEMLLELIDGRSESSKPTIITSNLSLENIDKTFDFRVHSRLAAKRNLILQRWDKDRRQL
jgi:DNA replication protein DnaC